MWETLIKVQKLIQSIRSLQVQYHEVKGGFHENRPRRRKYISFIIDSNVLITWIASLICLIQSLSAPQSTDPTKVTLTVQQSVLKLALQTLVFGLFSVFVASIWTFQYRSSTAVWMMTQAKRFHEKRQKSTVPSSIGKADPKLSRFDLLLYGMVAACFSGAVSMFLTPMLSSDTAAHLILHIIIPKNHFTVSILSCIYMTLFGFLGFVPVLQVFVYMCGVLYETQFMLKPAYVSNIKNAVILIRPSYFLRNKLIYMQCLMFQQSYNAFGYVYFPVVIGSAFVVNVVTSFICIQFYSEIHAMLFVCFAGLNLIVVALSLGIYSFAMISSEESNKFHLYWNKRLFKKLHRSNIIACAPITLKVGPYFVLKRMTLLNTTLEVVSATVSLLIMGG